MSKLSIIIPVYNAEKFLVKCLDSIVCQDNGEFEIIAINDGSKDNSLKILQGYSNKFSFIKIYDKENGGVSSARNLGLDKASGDFIWFVDADDEIEPNAIDNIFENLQYDLSIYNLSFQKDNKFYKSVCYTDLNNLFDLSNYDEFFNKKVFTYKLNNALFNKIFNKNIINKNNIRFRKDIKIGEDFLFSLDYYSCIKEIFFSKEFIYIYNENDGSAMHSFNSNAFLYQVEIAKEVKKLYIDKLSKEVLNQFMLMQLVRANGEAKRNNFSKEQIIDLLKQNRNCFFEGKIDKKVVKSFLNFENSSFLGKIRFKLFIKCLNKNQYKLLKFFM